MKLEISVKEVKDLINEIQKPDQLFEMMRIDLRKEVGEYLS